MMRIKSKHDFCHVCSFNTLYGHFVTGDNTFFEVMMRLMELGVVLGIGGVVWYIKRSSKEKP